MFVTGVKVCCVKAAPFVVASRVRVLQVIPSFSRRIFPHLHAHNTDLGLFWINLQNALSQSDGRDKLRATRLNSWLYQYYNLIKKMFAWPRPHTPVPPPPSHGTDSPESFPVWLQKFMLLFSTKDLEGYFFAPFFFRCGIKYPSHFALLMY